MMRKVLSLWVILGLASAAGAQVNQPKPALTSDDFGVGDYCTVILSPKLQDTLGLTAAQRASMAGEKNRLQTSVTAVDGKGGDEAGLINAGNRVLGAEGQRVRDILTTDQDAALQKMFTSKTLKAINVRVAQGKLALDYTNYSEGGTAAAARGAVGGPADGSRMIQTPEHFTGASSQAPMKPTTLAEAKAKMKPLTAEVAGDIRKAIADQAYVKGNMAGGAFANKDYIDLPKQGQILVGLRIGQDPQGLYIESLQPIYLTASGVAFGGLHGRPNMHNFVDLVAPPGYAVGGMNVAGGGGFNSVSLIYAKLDGGSLDTTDTFTTQKVGGDGGGGAVPLSSGASPIIGLVGKSQADGGYMGLGIITMPMTDAPQAQ
ncbi:MAG TPA: hypothetical protein VH253_19155 [Phycisphaerae bacterium]|nr:hypothetical protein [Phycisphaerae bacterium]